MATPQYIRVGNTLTNILDSVTGESVNYEKVDNWFDGTPMDDSKTDGVVYRKLENEYFIRIFTNGIVNAEWFGAKGDGITDDTIALQRGLDFARVRNLTFNWGDGKYRISSGLRMKSGSVTNGAVLQVYGNPEYAISINYSGSGTSDGAYLFYRDIQLPDVFNMSKPTTPTDWSGCQTGVIAVNLSECRVYTGIIQNFREGLWVAGQDSRGNAYNTYYIGHLRNNFTNLLLQPRDANSWVNENTFVAGRISRGNNTSAGKIFRIDTYGGGRFITTASVSITGGGGTGATGTVNISNGRITGITMTNQGSGYTSRPTITITHDGNGQVLGIARYGVEGSTHVSLLYPPSTSAGAPDNNRFIGVSIETGYSLELVDRHVYCEGSHNLFEHCRWEGFRTTAFLAGSGNRIVGGRGSETALIYELEGTNWGNHVIKDSQAQTFESTDDINIKLKNTANRPIIQAFKTGNIHNKYQTDQGWTLELHPDYIRAKQENDVYSRVNIDGVNGRINFSNGTQSAGISPYVGHRLNSGVQEIGVSQGNLHLLGVNSKLILDGDINIKGSQIIYGNGSPETVISGRVGDIYVANDNNATLGDPLWAKVTQGVSNDTWRAIQINRRGQTDGRPPRASIGTMFFDQTLQKPIWVRTAAVIDGSDNITTPAVWIDATGTIV